MRCVGVVLAADDEKANPVERPRRRPRHDNGIVPATQLDRVVVDRQPERCHFHVEQYCTAGVRRLRN